MLSASATSLTHRLFCLLLIDMVHIQLALVVLRVLFLVRFLFNCTVLRQIFAERFGPKGEVVRLTLLR